MYKILEMVEMGIRVEMGEMVGNGEMGIRPLFSRKWGNGDTGNGGNGEMGIRPLFSRFMCSNIIYF